MCGITGLVLKNKSAFNLKETIVRASQAIKHRGPDGEGFLLAGDIAVPCSSNDTPVLKSGLNYIPQKNISEVAGNFDLAFGHRRLSILDLSESGHQPMASRDEKLWITFNGEIYNYLELKKELEAEGAKFVSSSDTEVILYAYKHWGSDCLDKFNGMWAFCIYDAEKQELFCSRDRFGVKPFYYTDNENVFAFASEQKALVRSGIVKAAINQEALHDYFINNRTESEEKNFFEDIRELWPGHFIIYDLKTHKQSDTCWFRLEPEYDYSTDLETDDVLIKEVREKLIHAVSLRMRSDVPVGSCLSGGIDSSAIAVLMEQKDPVYLFTSVFKNEDIDESYYAGLVAKKVNCIHKTIEPDADSLFRELETLVYSQDVPIWDTSTYAQFKVMELARKNNIKVVLDGQGADELFAGYHHHFVAKWNYLLSYGNIFGFIREISQSKKTIDSPFSLFLKEKLKTQYNSYLKDIEAYFNRSFVTSFSVRNPTNYLPKVNDQLAYDITHARLKTFLKCEDRCGMWHGVESRTPFSDDIGLINLMFSINGTRKIKNGASKYFLREALKDKLPKEIYERYDKKGFETPMNKWIGGSYKIIFDQLDRERFPFIRFDQLRQKFDSGEAGTPEIKLLYKIYIMSLWNKVFLS